VPYCQRYTPTDCFLGDFTHWDNYVLGVISLFFLWKINGEDFRGFVCNAKVRNNQTRIHGGLEITDMFLDVVFDRSSQLKCFLFFFFF